jgi:hypothetical protein
MGVVRRTLVVAVALLAAWSPGAAVAGRHNDHDALADMWSSPVGALSYTAAPHHVEGDILATRVIHAPRAVLIRIRLRELTPAGNGNFHRIAIKSDRRFRYLSLDALPDHWGGTAQMTGSAGRPVVCAVHHRIDYDRNEIHLKVPRSCLGKPAWVRVGVRSTVAGALKVYADDAHSAGVPGTIALGPRVWH